MTNFTRDNNGWWRVPITPEIIEKAKQLHKVRGTRNSKTMWTENGGASFAGILGETVVELLLADKYQPDNQLTHDGFLKLPDGNVKSIDIKTKVTSRPPQPNHEQSIFEYTKAFQKPDYYIFVFVESDTPTDKTANSEYGYAYIVGGMPSSWIGTNPKVIFRPAGSEMPGSGVIQRRDNFFVKVKDLMRLEKNEPTRPENTNATCPDIHDSGHTLKK